MSLSLSVGHVWTGDFWGIVLQKPGAAGDTLSTKPSACQHLESVWHALPVLQHWGHHEGKREVCLWGNLCGFSMPIYVSIFWRRQQGKNIWLDHSDFSHRKSLSGSFSIISSHKARHYVFYVKIYKMLTIYIINISGGIKNIHSYMLIYFVLYFKSKYMSKYTFYIIFYISIQKTQLKIFFHIH